MQPISAETVEETWQRVGVMNPDQAPGLIEEMEREQPIILSYLTAGGEELFNQAEREMVVYLGVVVWQIMKQGKPAPEKVRFEDIEKAEENNLKMLEYLGKSTPSGFSQGVESLVTGYNQPEVLRYIVEALFSVDEDDQDETVETSDPEHEEEKVRDDMRGVIFIVLKTIIDCLDQQKVKNGEMGNC